MKLGFPLLPPGISKIAIGNFSRGSAGNQAITGLGFAPKVIIFFATDTAGLADIQSHGFSNVSQNQCIYKYGDAATQYQSLIRCIIVARTAANFIRGYVASMDADGFTVTWDLTGAATADVTYLAMR